MAEVSIIVPVYNVERYLARCLDSLLNNCFPDIEIICVNDGSTDMSREILEKYAQLDSRIKIIDKPNGGLSSARNAGIAQANGKYLMFVDSDDYISSISVELLYKNAEANNSDLVIFDFLWADYVSGEKKRLSMPEYGHRFENSPFNIDTMGSVAYKLAPISVWSKFYRTDLIKGKISFFEDIIFEDVPFWASIYTSAKRITYLPEPLYHYTAARPESIMADNGEKLFDIIKVSEIVEKIIKESGYWDKLHSTAVLLNIMNFILKFNALRPDLKEKFYYAVKKIDIEVDFNNYESGYMDFETDSIRKFKLWKELSYEDFCSKMGTLR